MAHSSESFVPYLFIPVPLFLVWGILSRRLKSTIALTVPSLIFVWIYHPYLFPQIAQSAQSDSQLSVMTYNVLFSNMDYDAVANVILTYHPDLVALQEVRIEMMNALEERLADDYLFSMMGTENNFGTTAVFSKYPITGSCILDLQADRPAVVVEIKVNDKEITFISTHLLAYGLQRVKFRDIPKAVSDRTTHQNRQVKPLLEEIEKGNGIVIIGCDCNSKETSSSYRILEQTMNNAARNVGWVLAGNELENVKQDLALQHIDYVWYRGELEPTRVYIVRDNGGSDHLPLLAIFNFK